MRRLHALLATLFFPLAVAAQQPTVEPVVVGGPATRFVVEIASSATRIPARIRVGTPTDITVVAVDSQDTVDTNYVGTIWFSVGQSTADVATLPGAYRFTAADQGRHTFVGGITAHRETSFYVQVFEESATNYLTGSAD